MGVRCNTLTHSLTKHKTDTHTHTHTHTCKQINIKSQHEHKHVHVLCPHSYTYKITDLSKLFKKLLDWNGMMVIYKQFAKFIQNINLHNGWEPNKGHYVNDLKGTG